MKILQLYLGQCSSKVSNKIRPFYTQTTYVFEIRYACTSERRYFGTQGLNQ